MNRAKLLLAVVVILAVSPISSGQQFEVASVRPNQTDNSGIEGRRISIQATPGSLAMRNVTLMSCIRWAYNVHDFQISGGPDWRDSGRFDIIAKPAAAATEDQMKLMLKALLADRFRLALRVQSKETPVYVLSVGKNGPKLRASKTDGPRGLRPDGGGIAFQNATMPDLQQFLSSLPSLDRPIVDRTGLDGTFDFSLVLVIGQLDDRPAVAKGAIAGAGAAAYADALERIGLKLEAQKLALEAIVIERAERPSDN